MLFAIYLMPLAAWLVFTYHMHHSGGRPTTVVWWAFMTGLGTFELGKGMGPELAKVPPLALAFCGGLLAAGIVLLVHARRARTVPAAAIAVFPAGGR